MTARRVARWAEHTVTAIVAFFLLLGMAEEADRRRQEGKR